MGATGHLRQPRVRQGPHNAVTLDAELIRVLFLCTGNSARSIIAEAVLNVRGKGRFEAFSAGSRPTGAVDPRAIDVLGRHQIPIDNLRSKSWDKFSAPGAAAFDVVVTVCDRAAAEVCPIWHGSPMQVHWSIADPAAAAGSDEEQRQAFDEAFRDLDARIREWTESSLPPDSFVIPG